METNLEDTGGMTGAEVHKLLSQYVAQLINGCGDARCTEIHCHTGAVNITQQPRRRLTPRSARAIAFTICDRPKARFHLCPYYDHATPIHERPDAERDTSSIVQQLVDAPFVRSLFDSNFGVLEPQNDEFKELHCLHEQLRPLHDSSSHLPGPGFVSNVTLADVLSFCLKWLLLHAAPTNRLAPWYWVDAQVISLGNAYPQMSVNMPADGNFNTWLAILDGLHHEPYSRLLRGICKIIASRLKVETALATLSPNRPRDAGRSICGLLVSRVVSETPSPERGIALVIWLKKLFAQQWNAELVVKDDTCHGILGLISALYFELRNYSCVRANVFVMHFITSHLRVTDIAQSWASQSGRNVLHLLRQRFLFTRRQRCLMFRTINHLTMSQAHRLVVQARKTREKVGGMKDRDINAQQQHAETNSLILSVSRKNMLKDTFDQLWCRRKGELRRPLRVRLGTITELQVGQDLGGVQMEFFNLLCREILNDQTDMFTTEPTTGCSYFKAGSSQPIAYFKHFGILLALAVFNGITLPITLPSIFYHYLVGGTPSHGCDTTVLDDGWPEIAKSLRNLSYEDIKDLDFSFDLQANGMHLSVLPPRQDRLEDVTKSKPNGHADTSILKVDAHHPNKIALEELIWPGWTFEKAEVEAEEVTPLNKDRYIREKICWHTYVSVAPQLSAVLEGFKSADLFPNDPLRHLFSYDDLKAYTEGTNRLDINELRDAASYTDYDPEEEYIQSFWDVVTAWPQSKQKQLLKFVTAAERIPIGGPSQLVFTIKRAYNPEHLPTSHTCFGTLDLPQYGTIADMDQKLSLALKYGSEGFGMG